MTAQAGNRIHIKGAFQCLLSAPEQGLWEQLGFRPPFAPESTDNWSGYTSHWAVREGRLYLTGITGMVCRRQAERGAEPSSWCRIGHFGECDRVDFRLSDIVALPHDGLLATWYSGELRIPQGDLVQYVHAGWASGYERDLILQVDCGEVTGEKIVRVSAIAPSRTPSVWKRCVSLLFPGRE